MDDLAEYLAKNEAGNEDLYQKKGWREKGFLNNNLFLPFTFMEYDEREESPEADALTKDVLVRRYMGNGELHEINRDLLGDHGLFTENLEKYIEQGDIKFELIQQGRFQCSQHG